MFQHLAGLSDFVPDQVNNMITLSTEISRFCLEVRIEDDNRLEGDEYFTAVLSTTDSAVALDPAVAVVTIHDNDG